MKQTLEPPLEGDRDGIKQPDPIAGRAWMFSLFGGLRILYAGKQVAAPPDRAHGLLSALLLQPRPLSRVYLCGLLYPDHPEDYGKRRVSNQLWLLRSSLPGLQIEAGRKNIFLLPKSRWLDVEAFKSACAGSDPQAWAEAVDLYRGDLLPDNYDEWVLLERENLLMSYIDLLGRLAEIAIAGNDRQRAIPYLQRLIQVEPLDEESVYRLMQAYACLGKRGAALSAYERFMAICRRENMQAGALIQSYARSLRDSYDLASVAIGFPLEEDESDPLLEKARQALAYGDRLAIQVCLDRLRAAPPPGRELQIALLKFDDAMLCGDRLSAEQHLRQAEKHLPGAEETIRSPDPNRLALQLCRADLESEGQDPANALDLSAQILLACQSMGDERLVVDSLLIQARAQMRLGKLSQSLMSTEKALLLARKSQSAVHIARALIQQGWIRLRQGRLERSLDSLQQAHRLGEQVGLRPQIARASHFIVAALLQMSRYLEALHYSRQETEIWRDLGCQRQEAQALQSLSIIECQLGKPENAIRALEAAQQILDALNEPLIAARNLYHLAATIPFHDEAQVTRSFPLAERAMQVFQERGQTGWYASTLATLGYNLWLDGQYEGALEKLRQAYELHERLGEMGILPELLAYQALALLGLERLDEALACSEGALLALSGLTLESDMLSEIYYAHAAVLQARGDQASARRYYLLGYQNLLKYAGQLEDETARQAFFQRDPTIRRLMAAVYRLGIAQPPESGVVRERMRPRASFSQAPLPVHLTLDAGPTDQALGRAKGSVTLRRRRLQRILEEANLQGAAPTIKQLAGLLGVSQRTIKRDLAALRSP